MVSVLMLLLGKDRMFYETTTSNPLYWPRST